MAGSALKRVRRDIVREAVLRAHGGGDGIAAGGDPVDVMAPYIERLREIALGDDPVVALAALKEVFDRVDGRVTQRVEVEEGRGGLVDMALVGAASELLMRLPEPRREVDVTPVVGERDAEPA